jgi:hypothetical protein
MARCVRSAVALVAVTAGLAVPTSLASQSVGPTAKCRDGTYSYSHHRRGTCSHHHGVAKWLRQVPA